MPSFRGALLVAAVLSVTHAQTCTVKCDWFYSQKYPNGHFGSVKDVGSHEGRILNGPTGRL